MQKCENSLPNHTDDTIQAITQYRSMRWIVEHTEQNIQELQEMLTAPRAPSFEESRSAHNPLSGEDRMISVIDRMDEIKLRYQNAKAFIHWFEPAWNQLSEEDQKLLESTYMDKVPVRALKKICRLSQYGYYTRRDHALAALTLLLYGMP